MFLGSSIAKKQIVAFTGFLLILFVIAHLAGNLLIYGGPRVFNAYAHKLHSMGPLLLLARAGLLAVFLIHIFVIHILVIQNIKARGGLKRYAIEQAVGQRTLAEKVMLWSGIYIFIFVIFHILDFAAADTHGPRSYLYDHSYGLYGLVINSFSDPVHAVLYVIAMYFLGMHLAHAIQSLAQTSGFHPKSFRIIKKTSNYMAVIIATSFSTIPIYVYLLTH
jgi:succinate dehydrogenase / fumarate reductase, cytochrome b subunit